MCLLYTLVSYKNVNVLIIVFGLIWPSLGWIKTVNKKLVYEDTKGSSQALRDIVKDVPRLVLVVLINRFDPA